MLTTNEKVTQLREAGIPVKKIGLILGIPAKEVRACSYVPPRADNLKETIIQRIAAGRSTPRITQELNVSSRKIAAYRAHVTRGSYSTQSSIPFCWKNQPFPQSDDVEHLTLPDGRTLEDTCVWRNFMQTELGIDPADIWNELLQLPDWPDAEPIPFRADGSDPHWIRGSHRALNYRGNAINRHKIWCQADYSEGLRRYNYTGWQWRISCASHDVKYVDPVRKIATALNEGLNHAHNHWIVTKYENGSDNIGFHADKTTDFEPNSYFIVLKFGASRPFEFRMKSGKGSPPQEPFYSEVLPAGTAIFCRAKSEDGLDANSTIEHGVPPVATPCELSGSIVSRCISTVVPWEQVTAQIAQSNQASKKHLQHVK